VAGLAVAARLAEHYGLIPPDCGGIYGPGETMNYAVQKVLTMHSLAREFPRNMISTTPFANETSPPTKLFNKLQAQGAANWQLAVDGLVARPGSLSMTDIKSLPMRSQITEISCEEGWSYIAEWIGTPLFEILNAVGIQPQARYVVYYSTDPDWWDSLDMADALHPQTILAWGMNDGDLPVKFGGPLRMRVPRQLGYKSIKYITRLTVTDNIKKIGKGFGSSEPESGYAWYAGI
jgi:DMSO/TMAO reductase YedYZ molybdopterin-dependent catalytic subunit